MTSGDSGSASSPETPQTISFYYLKTPDYRQIFVDGAVGGLTPKGLIHMAVYSEHVAVPQKTVQAFEKNGTLGPELQDQRVSREGIVRDLAAALIFDEATAHQLIDWLQLRLSDLKAARQSAEGQGNAENKS
jgi:hypothetical protein